MKLQGYFDINKCTLLRQMSPENVYSQHQLGTKRATLFIPTFPMVPLPVGSMGEKLTSR